MGLLYLSDRARERIEPPLVAVIIPQARDYSTFPMVGMLWRWHGNWNVPVALSHGLE